MTTRTDRNAPRLMFATSRKLYVCSLSMDAMTKKTGSAMARFSACLGSENR